MRETFSENANWYGNAFYVSLGILLLVIFILHLLIADGTLKFIETPISDKSSWGIMLLALFRSSIFKLPFILPAFWLVVFVSKRRNEALRLEQEYAHKESLAKSYDSYRQQIEKLNPEDKDKLLPILMENMIRAIALNPAETLDKDHKEENPVEDLMKKKEIWDFWEKVKNSIPTNSK